MMKVNLIALVLNYNYTNDKIITTLIALAMMIELKL